MRYFEILDRALSRTEEALVAALLVAASLILFADIAARFLFNDSFSWAAESVRYAIIWTVFIGASVAVRRRAHISIDALKEFLPDRAGRPLVLVSLAVTALFAALMLWYGVQLVRTMQNFRQLSPAMQIPMWWVYLALPLGAGLILLRLVQAMAAELGFRREARALQSAGQTAR